MSSRIFTVGGSSKPSYEAIHLLDFHGIDINVIVLRHCLEF